MKKFCPSAKVQVVTSKTKINPDTDYIIMNPTNVPKRPRSDYEHIGFMIVDELHLIMAAGMSKCMRMIVPRFLLGLSATPYRDDDLHAMIGMYFGDNVITRKLNRKHIVYKVTTSFVPETEQTKDGGLDWNSVLTSQADNSDRNAMLVDIIRYFPDRVFLVMCKRVSQGQDLVERLTRADEDVTSLIGDQQTYDSSARILVGIASKTSTGFDHPRLDALLLACDVKAYFIQYLGRIFRREDTVPIVFDVVDRNFVLKRHFNERLDVYKEVGGEMKNFYDEYSDFRA
jgi:superfamily II DNA or RNA helicase